jgi:hypothetical protein
MKIIKNLKVGGARAVWAACLAPLNVQMSLSMMVLEAESCPLHSGTTRVNGGCEVDL